MSVRCQECGAPIPDGGSCRDNLHDLLALEWDVPGGAGTVVHFFAVSSYGLQHPVSMQYTVEAIAWLKSAVAQALETGCSIESLRASARTQGQDAHVTRRDGDPVADWGVARWTSTVADILAGGVDGYAERVRTWAAAVVSDIDAVASYATGGDAT